MIFASVVAGRNRERRRRQEDADVHPRNIGSTRYEMSVMVRVSVRRVGGSNSGSGWFPRVVPDGQGLGSHHRMVSDSLPLFHNG
jgi:hypothetical protein